MTFPDYLFTFVLRFNNHLKHYTMAKIKVAINGFGRIGRNVFKLAFERPDIEIIGINDLTDTKTLAHLLKYDSTQGKFPGVTHDEQNIIVNGKKIRVQFGKEPGSHSMESKSLTL